VKIKPAFQKIFLPLVLAPLFLRAQTPPQIPPAMQAQLQVQQPPVDVSVAEKIAVTAEFDPPVMRPGEKSFYRVAVSATQNSIEWPDAISAPPELRFGAATREQLMQPDGVRFQPLTEFIYEITPMTTGHFAISNFVVLAGGRSVEVPAAGVDVKTDAVTLSARKLSLEVSATNLFLDQPFRVRVILPATQGNQIEALRDVQFNGGGFLTDKLVTHQSIEPVDVNGQLKPAAIYETVATPLAAGTLALSAQAFTANVLSVPISIHAQTTISSAPVKNVLLISDAVKINVRPLPSENEPPSFTGAIGKFFRDPPQLSTNRLRVGEPAHLKIIFHGEGDLTRFVPPATPRSRDWQVIADKAPDAGFTLIPQTDAVTNTPAIPFCAFDPATGKYYDLTIPALPVTVIGDGLPINLPALENENPSATPPKLSDLATSAGKTAASLKPLQLRGWFVCVQLVPVIGFLALWQWDCRRRFWEAHPDLFRRRAARRALRRKNRELQITIARGDAAGFVRHAVDSLRIAVAPHFPAEPRALVCADVLAQLNDAERSGHTGETVRKIFAAADAQFATTHQTSTDLLALAADVETVLQKLEEKL
jgi:hypothetical protein